MHSIERIVTVINKYLAKQQLCSCSGIQMEIYRCIMKIAATEIIMLH